MFDARVFAAVDIGTHAIGGGWTTSSPENDSPETRKIHFFNSWESQPSPTVKNLSALLLDAGGEMIAWGFEARRMWLTQGMALRTAGARYYHGFKMDLGALKEATRPAASADPVDDDAEPGRTDNACGVSSQDLLTTNLLTMLLRQVVQTMLHQITASGYDEDDIRWVITVPACFTDYQKAIYRDVIKNAGLPGEDGRVLLSLEPEAAAHYARVSGARTGDDGPPLMAPGARFMVVDCGGGTVDITAYQNDQDGKMIEIGRSLGDRLGSDFLNRRIESEYILEAFGKDVMEDIREECPDALLHMIDQWERAKVAVRLDQEENINLLIPTGIDRKMGATGRRRLARRQNKVDDALVFTPAQLHTVFDTVVPGTLGLIEAQLTEMESAQGDPDVPNVIVLAGGFSNSPYLQQAIKERFSARATIVVPPNPDIAVLAGAVHFCYDPQIRARRSRFTYGIDTAMAFEEGVDPESSRVSTPDGERCADRFNVFTTAGQSVPTDAEVCHVIFPLFDGQKRITFGVYATRDVEPRYVTADGCDQLAEVTIDLGPVMRFDRAERGVRTFMKFGETEVKVRAELVQGGGEAATQVRFHSNY
ncbi:Hsp70 family protein [Streptomyces sp. f51]|uniref:Hsp70 family protein n=1 Tax=Streptomyces sp. f51 TaxID=1827742 RepID=UPI0011816991|nr:Hsp70 family protein [Streptomyces sp. f51]